MIDLDLYLYIKIALMTLLLSCFLRGFSGKKYTTADVIDSLLWPLTFVVIIGTITRVIADYIFKKIEKGNK